MSAYLTDKKDFYNGNHTTFGVNTVVAKAGGSNAHLSLFNFLITPSFPTIDPQTGKTGAYFDHRGAQSMLFLFPPQVQILFIALLYREDLIVKSTLEDLEGNYYNSQLNYPSQEIVLDLSKTITKINFGRTVVKALHEPPSELWDNRMKFLLCIKSQARLFDDQDITVEQRISRIVNILNFQSPYLEHFIDVAKTSNRIKSAAFITQALGYPAVCTQALVNIIESWILSNT